jgi:putative phosphoesterase
MKRTSGIFNDSKKIGILSDAHGNALAFSKGIRVLEAAGVDSFWFLGDSIGYIPSVDVIDLIRALGTRIQCVSGNHERMVISDIENTQNDHVYQHSLIRSRLSSAQMAEIKSWPSVIQCEFEGTRVMFCHGSPLDHTEGYVYEDTDLSVFTPEVDLVFMGNTHRPFIRKSNDVTYVNVGSCGLPRDDGTLGSVAVFDIERGDIDILRFTIENETSKVLSGVPFVHESVIETIKRRPSDVYGVKV